MNATLKIILTFIILTALALGIYFSSKNKSTKSEPLNQTHEEYSFLRLESCLEAQENNCRIIAENPLALISFKIDYRYRDLLTPSFSVIKTSSCIKEIKFKDERTLTFNCLDFFIKPKENSNL